MTTMQQHWQNGHEQVQYWAPDGSNYGPQTTDHCNPIVIQPVTSPMPPQEAGGIHGDPPPAYNEPPYMDTSQGYITHQNYNCGYTQQNHQVNKRGLSIFHRILFFPIYSKYIFF